MVSRPDHIQPDDPPSSLPAVLVVDDDPIVAESLAEFLTREGYQALTASDGIEALAILEAQPGPAVGVVITDMIMPRCDGMALLRKLRERHEGIVPIVITGFGKIESAVEAVKNGATDYLIKPIVEHDLRLSVQKAVRQHALLAENRALKTQLTQRFGLDNIVGSDYRMQKVYDLIDAVADSKTTVLIEGQSGTGKSMIARAIHTRSPRRAKPFVTFACGSIPETLLESELFGHVKGAFTGADADKPGKILAAQGGTLFIDEINSATPSLQLKLLRVLQERQFDPVGSSKTVHVDVRFVLATNQSLKELVAAGDFREDLYYRINVVNIQLPPLRERVGDIPLLAKHFLERHGAELGRTVTSFTEAAMQALQRYRWPGNVRELENAIERAVVLSRRPVIDLPDLPDTVRGEDQPPQALRQFDEASRPAGSAADIARYIPALSNGWTPMPLEQALLEPERRILLAALEANQWNRQATARQLGINRTTLYKKMRDLSLEPGEA